MLEWQDILIKLVKFFLTVQFNFILFCLTLYWQSNYEKQYNILFMLYNQHKISKKLFSIMQIQKKIQLKINYNLKLEDNFFIIFMFIIFYRRNQDQEDYLKYHLCYYFLMDQYGLYLRQIKVGILWIILSQLLIGVIVLGCILIYCLFYTIFSYLINILTCKQSQRLDDILWYYLILSICVTSISFNLFRVYEFSNFIFWQQIIRMIQYISTLLIYENGNKDHALIYHYIMDTLINIFSLLELKYESIFFWVIISQIALGCFHYCLVLLNLLLYTISKYYLQACSYIQFRLERFLSSDCGQYIINITILYLITQLAYTIQICIKYFYQHDYNMPLYELIYLFLRVKQYSFHLIVYAFNQGFAYHFNYQFAYYFLMDLYGFIILKLQSQIFWQIFWIIFFQIIIGIIIYYFLVIEFIRIRSTLFKFQFAEQPFENLILSFFMFELGFSILVFKLEYNSDSLYLLFRIAQYAMLSSLFITEENQKKIELIYGLIGFFAFVNDLFIFGWGIKLVIFQGQFIFIYLSQLLFDFLMLGIIIFPFDQKKVENLIEIWQQENSVDQFYTYEMSGLLWLL